jgi:hypothetical protein
MENLFPQPEDILARVGQLDELHQAIKICITEGMIHPLPMLVNNYKLMAKDLCMFVREHK